MPNGQNPAAGIFDDLRSQQPLSTTTTIVTTNPAQGLFDGLNYSPQLIELPQPLASVDADSAIATITPPTQELATQTREQNESTTLRALKFLADVSGLKSTFEVVAGAPIIGEPLSNAWQKITGKRPDRATTGDFVVAGITVLGGIGLRGALALARGALRTVAKPVLAAGDDAVRAGVSAFAEATARPTAAAAARRAITEVGEELPHLTLPEIQRAVDVATEALRNGQLIGDPVIHQTVGRVFNRIGEAYRLGEIDIDGVARLMVDYGVKDVEGARALFARMMTEGISESGRTLQRVGQFKKSLAQALTPEERSLAGLADVEVADSVIRVARFGTVATWRSSITAQLATAMRNLEVGLIRMPLQFFSDVATGAVRTFTGQTGARAAFKPAFENLFAIMRGMKRGTRARVEKLLTEIDPLELHRLYQRPLWEMAAARGIAPKRLQRALDFLQTANRTQENIVRSIAFDAKLSGRLAERGLTWEQVMRAGIASFDRPTQRYITRSAGEAVNFALDTTFALAPRGGLGGALLNLYRQFPELSVIHPFPRFLSNSLRFLRDHSPFGVVRFATEAQRRTLYKSLGEAAEREAAEAIGKVMSGYMMFAGALAFRNSDMAGEKWYEVKVGDKRIDARPFNPLAAYLLVAEAIRQGDDPTAGVELRTSDFAEAFAGIRRLSGTGLYIINLFDADAQAFEKGTKRFVSEFLGGFTTPFRQIRDFLALADEDEAVYRRGEGVLGRAISNLPLLGQTQPPSPPGARAEPEVIRGAGALRQLTGISLRGRTPLESELTRLDVSAFPRTGDDKLNRLISEQMGPEVERRLSRIIRAPSYQRLNDFEQTERLTNELSKIKRRAKARVLRDERPRIIRELVEELRGKPRAEQQRELRRRRNSGAITAAIERAVLARLRR